MSGLSTLIVELDDGTDTFPYNISGYALLTDGWDFGRGRNDENDTVEPGTLRLTLNNNDGRFTLGNVTYGCRLDQRIRVRETVGASTYNRYSGYVQDWPTEWTNRIGNAARATVTASDRLSRLGRRKLRSVIENEILEDSPVAYYTLGEPEGSLTAGDTSGTGIAPLTQVSTGVAVAFGADGLDGLTAATITTGGKYLQSPVIPATFTAAAFGMWYAGADPTEHYIGGLDGLLYLRLKVGAAEVNVCDSTGATVLTATAQPWTDGAQHHYAVTVSGTTWTLYVDGASVDSAAVGAISATGVSVVVGAGRIADGYGTIGGTYSHVHADTSTLTAARILAHYQAGATGFASERSDQRIARLAAYANIATGDQNLETGLTTAIPVAVTEGQSVVDAMRTIESAEGGVLFIAGDGKLTFHNRQHRALEATQTAALTLAIGEYDPPYFSGARDYLVNTVTGMREGGAVQRVADATSVGLYEEYPSDLGTLLVTTDAEVLDRMTWTVALYKDPRSRASSLVLDLLTLPQARVQAALAVELGDRVTIGALPTAQSPGGSATADLLVEGLKEEQTLTSWRLTFNTVPAPLYQAWILGDATYGQLGTTTRLYY